MSEARPTVDVTYRRAEEADLPRVFAVFRAALNAYLVPAGQEGIPEDEEQSPVYRHFLEHDGERFWVAEAVVEDLTDGGGGTLGAGGRQIVGWGSGLLRGDWWFLSSLFVLPEAQGRGVGAPAVRAGGDGRAAGSGARHRHRLAAAHLEHAVRASRPAAARGARRVRRTGRGRGSPSRGSARSCRSASPPPPIPELREIDAGGERPRPQRRPRVLPDRRRPVRLAVPPPRPPGRLRRAATGRLGGACRVRCARATSRPSRPTPSPIWPGAGHRQGSAAASPAAARARSGRSGRPGWSSPARPACSSPRARSAASTATSSPATGCSERGAAPRPAAPAPVIRAPRDTVR